MTVLIHFANHKANEITRFHRTFNFLGLPSTDPMISYWKRRNALKGSSSSASASDNLVERLESAVNDAVLLRETVDNSDGAFITDGFAVLLADSSLNDWKKVNSITGIQPAQGQKERPEIVSSCPPFWTLHPVVRSAHDMTQSKAFCGHLSHVACLLPENTDHG